MAFGNGKTTNETARTRKDGKVTFQIDQTGKWMISAVQMVPNGDTKQEDRQSYWEAIPSGFIEIYFLSNMSIASVPTQIFEGESIPRIGTSIHQTGSDKT